MTTGMPELGSKISLISKADIRYEGRLFTVDPQECTIALAAVRSFGTEDRETKYPVAPQNQVYDYILFRGSDIKDIRVVNNVIPNDPAIMQLSVPPSLGPQPYQQPGFSHPVLGHMNQYQPYGTGLGPIGGGLPAGIAPGMGMQRGGPKQQSAASELIGGSLGNTTDLPSVDPGVRSNDSASVLDLISGGSRSTTPVSLISRKSPTMDAGVQVNATVGVPSNQDDKKSGGQQRQGHGAPGQQRPRRESGGRNQDQRQGQGRGNQQMRQYSQNQQHMPGTSQQNDRNQSGPPQQRQQQGWNRGNNMRMRGRGRGQNQGNFRGQGPVQGQTGPRPKNTLKFDNDYDFEQANTQFEELRSQLAKVKIEEQVPKATSENGDTEKKDDSGNETGAGEAEVEEDSEVYYDKAKSFFDNISCEAVERSKGRSQRTDWRTERKLNSETFGVASARRGGYRGRGNYFNRGAGGYRGGYRNYRGNQTGQRVPRQNQPQGIQQPSQPVPQPRPPVVAAAGK